MQQALANIAERRRASSARESLLGDRDDDRQHVFDAVIEFAEAN
jgi:hypothetical protein